MSIKEYYAKHKRKIKSGITTFSLIYLSVISFNNNRLFLNEKNAKEAVQLKCEKLISDKAKVIDSLKKEKQVLRYQYENVLLHTIENTYDLDDIPFPGWRKVYDNKSGIFAMNYLNRAYERMFLRHGVSRIQYLGNTDYIAHGSELADEYKIADIAALNSKQSLDFYERYRKKNGQFGVVKVKKWKVVKNGQTFVYGIVLDY